MCKFLYQENCESYCKIAYELSGFPTKTTEKACESCSKLADPQRPNRVTASLAIASVRQNKPEELKGMMDTLKQFFHPTEAEILAIGEGPGTELKRMLSWFAVDTPDCECMSHAVTMNIWGSEGCKNNIETILDWLEREAKARDMMFSRMVAAGLVRIAIMRAELRCLLKSPSSSISIIEEIG